MDGDQTYRPTARYFRSHLFRGPLAWGFMATASPSSEPTPQRLAAVRRQLSLLADYL